MSGRKPDRDSLLPAAAAQGEKGMLQRINGISGNVLLAIFLIIWAVVLMCAGSVNAA